MQLLNDKTFTLYLFSEENNLINQILGGHWVSRVTDQVPIAKM